MFNSDLRNTFAASALQGLVHNNQNLLHPLTGLKGPDRERLFKNMAITAFKIADAMMIERNDDFGDLT